MNIEHLIMFCHVVEQGSISEAARSGFVSQPAVTKQIRQLENRYNTRLFNRTTRKLSLTETGEILYEYAKEMIYYYKKSQEAVSLVAEESEIYLHIGASPTIGDYLLPELLGVFTKKNRNLKFNLTIGNTPAIFEQLKNNIIDVALVEGITDEEYSAADKKITIEKFTNDQLILIAAPNHHNWIEREEINIQELKGQKMIFRETISGTRRIIEKALKEHGVFDSLDCFLELGSIQSIKSAVEADLGISIVPKVTVKRELKFGLLREIKIKNVHLSRDLYIVQKNHRFPKIGLNKFINFVKENMYLL